MRVPFQCLCYVYTKNFNSAVYSRFNLLKLTWGFTRNFDCLLWNDLNPVLLTFIVRSFLFNQISNSAITLSVFLWTAHTSLSIISTLMSSTNVTRFAPWIFKGRSFMYSKNNSGLSTDHCGTPCLISILEDLYLSTIALLESLWLISIHSLLVVNTKPHRKRQGLMTLQPMLCTVLTLLKR